jgi:hypothetical protein
MLCIIISRAHHKNLVMIRSLLMEFLFSQWMAKPWIESYKTSNKKLLWYAVYHCYIVFVVEPTIKILWLYDHYWWSNAQFSVFTKHPLVAKPWFELCSSSKGNKLCPHTIHTSSIKGKAQFVVELLVWRHLNDRPNAKTYAEICNLIRTRFRLKTWLKIVHPRFTKCFDTNFSTVLPESIYQTNKSHLFHSSYFSLAHITDISDCCSEFSSNRFSHQENFEYASIYALSRWGVGQR